MWTENFQTCKLGFKEAEEPEIKLATFVGSWKKQGNSRKTSSSVWLIMWMNNLTMWLFNCVDNNKCEKFLTRWDYQTTLPVCWEKCMVETRVRTRHGTTDWETGSSIYLSPYSVQFSSVQSLSHVRLLVTPWIAARQASLSITNSPSSPKPMSNELVMPSSHLILCCPLLFPPIPPSIRVFSNESTLRVRWPKYWSFSFSIIPSKEIPGLISFRMGWLDLPAVQGTLKSLLQHHSSKASILRHSAFFTDQLSHPYVTTGKTIALTRWTFVGKVMSLLVNMLCRLVITFLPRSKHLLISWLQSPSAVILEPQKI